MQIDNLTESNVKELQEKVAELAQENPDIRSRTFVNNPAVELADRLDHLIVKMEQMERFLNRVFDGHVLINGEFKKINV